MKKAFGKQKLNLCTQRFKINGYYGENFIILDFYKKNNPTIIISAHYDGFGAYDNAGGVLTLLWLIRWAKLTKGNKNYDLSFLSVFFDGEESGLLGAKHFFQTPLLRNISIYSHISVDGFGIGTHIGGFANMNEVKLKKGNKEKDFFIQTDDDIFQKKKIPSLCIFTLPKEELLQLISKKTFPNTWDIIHTDKDTPDKIEEGFIPYLALYLYKNMSKLDFQKKDIVMVGG